jgi:hypothetical protein
VSGNVSPALRAAYELAGALASKTGEARRRAPAWQWCRPGVVEAVMIAPSTHGRRQSRVLRIAVVDEIPAALIPAHVPSPLDGTCIPVETCRSRRPRLQAGGGAWQFCVRNETNDAGPGTLAALVLRNDNPGRYFALSAGHVVAGHPESVFGDSVSIAVHGRALRGTLHEWRPSIGSPVNETDIDAGLVELSPADAKALAMALGDALTTGAVSATEPGMDITVRNTQSGGAIAAQILGEWSGWVDIGTTTVARDYFFNEGVTYLAQSPVQPGDSGAAIWNTLEEIVGVHFAGAPPGTPDWNGIFCPIGRLVRAFGISVLTRQQARARFGAPPAAPVPPAQPPAVPLAAPPPSAASPLASEEEVILARTLWGEARGEGIRGMQAVAAVVLNRAARQKYWGKTIAEVCRKPYQFSCWNVNDPNLPRLLKVGTEDSLFRAAIEVAKQAVAGTLVDETGGATHYYASWLTPIPKWAAGKIPSARIGNHIFFADIA